MRKIALILSILAIIALIIDLAMSNKGLDKDYKITENYCAITYSTNVQEYKQCTKLKPTEILEKLTKEAQTKYDVPKLPEIKGLK